MLLQYLVLSLVLKTKEVISCAAAGIFISTIPEASNFYYNTAVITSVCELRANLDKHNIHPLRWSMNKIFKEKKFIDNCFLLS